MHSSRGLIVPLSSVLAINNHGERSWQGKQANSRAVHQQSPRTVRSAGLKIATKVVPSEVAAVWDKATGKPRVVFTIG